MTPQNFPLFIAFLREASKLSVCKRRGVAACLISDDLQMIGWGINSPAGNNPKLCTGIKDGCFCVHSELNCILNSRVTATDRRHGCLMLATRQPCRFCASVIVNCQFIKKVIYLDESEQGSLGDKILKDNHITCEQYASS